MSRSLVNDSLSLVLDILNFENKFKKKFEISLKKKLSHKCVQWSGGDEISHLSNRTKQNDPKQTYLHISAPTNLQYHSLWQEILTSIKQYGKKEIKSIIKKYT